MSDFDYMADDPLLLNAVDPLVRARAEQATRRARQPRPGAAVDETSQSGSVEQTPDRTETGWEDVFSLDLPAPLLHAMNPFRGGPVGAMYNQVKDFYSALVEGNPGSAFDRWRETRPWAPAAGAESVAASAGELAGGLDEARATFHAAVEEPMGALEELGSRLAFNEGLTRPGEALASGRGDIRTAERGIGGRVPEPTARQEFRDTYERELPYYREFGRQAREASPDVYDAGWAIGMGASAVPLARAASAPTVGSQILRGIATGAPLAANAMADAENYDTIEEARRGALEDAAQGVALAAGGELVGQGLTRGLGAAARAGGRVLRERLRPAAVERMLGLQPDDIARIQRDLGGRDEYVAALERIPVEEYTGLLSTDRVGLATALTDLANEYRGRSLRAADALDAAVAGPQTQRRFVAAPERIPVTQEGPPDFLGEGVTRTPTTIDAEMLPDGPPPVPADAYSPRSISAVQEPGPLPQAMPDPNDPASMVLDRWYGGEPIAQQQLGPADLAALEARRSQVGQQLADAGFPDTVRLYRGVSPAEAESGFRAGDLKGWVDDPSVLLETPFGDRGMIVSMDVPREDIVSHYAVSRRPRSDEREITTMFRRDIPGAQLRREVPEDLAVQGYTAESLERILDEGNMGGFADWYRARTGGPEQTVDEILDALSPEESERLWAEYIRSPESGGRRELLRRARRWGRDPGSTGPGDAYQSLTREDAEALGRPPGLATRFLGQARDATRGPPIRSGSNVLEMPEGVSRDAYIRRGTSGVDLYPQERSRRAADLLERYGLVRGVGQGRVVPTDEGLEQWANRASRGQRQGQPVDLDVMPPAQPPPIPADARRVQLDAEEIGREAISGPRTTDEMVEFLEDVPAPPGRRARGLTADDYQEVVDETIADRYRTQGGAPTPDAAAAEARFAQEVEGVRAAYPDRVPFRDALERELPRIQSDVNYSRTQAGDRTVGTGRRYAAGVRQRMLDRAAEVDPALADEMRRARANEALIRSSSGMPRDMSAGSVAHTIPAVAGAMTTLGPKGAAIMGASRLAGGRIPELIGAYAPKLSRRFDDAGALGQLLGAFYDAQRAAMLSGGQGPLAERPPEVQEAEDAARLEALLDEILAPEAGGTDRARRDALLEEILAD